MFFSTEIWIYVLTETQSTDIFVECAFLQACSVDIIMHIRIMLEKRKFKTRGCKSSFSYFPEVVMDSIN